MASALFSSCKRASHIRTKYAYSSVYTRNSSSLKSSSSTSASTLSSNSKSTKAEPPLPTLSRPLGVRTKPSTQSQSKLGRLKDVLTKDEAIREQRKLIVKEAVTKGYFHDLNATRRHGGKTWIAPKVLIKEDKSLYLPNISGKPLDGKEKAKHTTEMCLGKISVLGILSTRISEIHIASFLTPTLTRYSSHPSFQNITINLQLNPLKSLLLKFFLASLRRSVPQEEHGTYLVSSGASAGREGVETGSVEDEEASGGGGGFEYIREALRYDNDRVGYVYLVDQNLRIRWAGCADATPEEARSLEVCAGLLLKRLEEQNGPRKTTSKD